MDNQSVCDDHFVYTLDSFQGITKILNIENQTDFYILHKNISNQKISSY